MISISIYLECYISYTKYKLLERKMIKNNEDDNCLNLNIEIWELWNRYNGWKLKNSYRIRIKVRWCRDSILWKKFWKFIPHTFAHPCTPVHTRAHPCTPVHTHPHQPTHAHWCWFWSDQSYVNRPIQKRLERRYKEKGRNKRPLKHISRLKRLTQFPTSDIECIDCSRIVLTLL